MPRDDDRSLRVVALEKHGYTRDAAIRIAATPVRVVVARRCLQMTQSRFIEPEKAEDFAMHLLAVEDYEDATFVVVDAEAVPPGTA